MPNGHDTELSAILARMDERLKNVQADVVDIKVACVTRDEFEPIKRVVYGLVGATLITVVGAILALVIVRGG